MFSKSFFPLNIIFLLYLLYLFKGIVCWIFCILFFWNCIWIFKFWGVSKLDWIDSNLESDCWGLACTQKNKYSYLDSKDRRCPIWYIPLNLFSRLNFQVETWGVDVGARLIPNHYKFSVFVVLASLYLFFVPYNCNLIICVWIYFYWKSILSTQTL